MTITYGPRLGLMENAATGEAHDSAFRAFLRGMDALIQASVKTIGGNTPPASPANGDCHIIGSSPTGAWAGNGGKLTRYSTVTAGWEFFNPKAGWVAFCDADSKRYEYSGSAWAVQSSGGATVQNYSTSEQNTGQKDINGYDIYWKTIDCGALPNATYKFINHNIANLRRMIKGEGVFRKTDNSSVVFMNLVFPTNPAIGFGAYANATQIVIATGTDRTDHVGEMTVWYTKTV